MKESSCKVSDLKTEEIDNRAKSCIIIIKVKEEGCKERLERIASKASYFVVFIPRLQPFAGLPFAGIFSTLWFTSVSKNP